MDSNEMLECNGIESEEGFSLLEKPTMSDADSCPIPDPSDLKFTDGKFHVPAQH